ncbi:RNA-binding protein Cwf29 [Rhodotorula toruloides ATCC 204091]|nr:RNA-binding protein Cwf29 [Rhodotorula toruloides ATCC 204091]
MNQIQAIKRINEQELQSGSAASWHDQYKDSAYINVGGLPYNLTEGDVITIFSQYGEIVDINMPRDPQTGKPRGFAWLMYADQRSTVLAVDNLNGAQVLGRTLRVDHVLNYKQLERDQESGKMKERDEQSLAAHPEKFLAKPSASDAEDSDSSHPSIDPDDPMRDYLISEKRKVARQAAGGERTMGVERTIRAGGKTTGKGSEVDTATGDGTSATTTTGGETRTDDEMTMTTGEGAMTGIVITGGEMSGITGRIGEEEESHLVETPSQTWRNGVACLALSYRLMLRFKLEAWCKAGYIKDV